MTRPGYPGGAVPGDQSRLSPGPGSPGAGPGSSGVGPGSGVTAAGYPPMMPPMMGGGMGGMGGGMGGKDNGERERHTWLQEDDSVWMGEELATASLGRPDEEEEEEAIDEWATPVKRPRSGPRTQRPMPGGYSKGGSRRS